MEQTNVLRHLAWITAVLVAAVVSAGCDYGGTAPPEQTSSEIASRQPQPELEPAPGPDPGKPQIDPDPKPEPAAETELEPKPIDERPSLPGLELQGREAETRSGTLTFESPEPDVEPAPVPEPEPETSLEPAPEPEPATPDARKTPDLGPPLVKDRKTLFPLDKTRPVWLDKQNKRVVMVGQICQREALLELFACLRNTKEHEAVVSVDVEAFKVHAGLLAVGAKPGHPAKWDPEYVPAAGTEIEVTVVWKDEKGEQKTARAQDWILDTQTQKAMKHPWVFAGSMFWKDGETGKKYYQAEGGDFICVSNFPSAMLDLPIESSQANNALMFRAFTEQIPPLGTPVTLLLTPKLQEKQEPHDKDPKVGTSPAG